MGGGIGYEADRGSARPRRNQEDFKEGLLLDRGSETTFLIQGLVYVIEERLAGVRPAEAPERAEARLAHGLAADAQDLGAVARGPVRK